MLSSELLGYSSEARVLIINADDFGMYQIEAVLATGLIPTHLDCTPWQTVGARISSILVLLWLRSIGWPPQSGWNAGGGGATTGPAGC